MDSALTAWEQTMARVREETRQDMTSRISDAPLGYSMSIMPYAQFGLTSWNKTLYALLPDDVAQQFIDWEKQFQAMARAGKQPGMDADFMAIHDALIAHPAYQKAFEQLELLPSSDNGPAAQVVSQLPKASRNSPA